MKVLVTCRELCGQRNFVSEQFEIAIAKTAFSEPNTILQCSNISVPVIQLNHHIIVCFLLSWTNLGVTNKLSDIFEYAGSKCKENHALRFVDASLYVVPRTKLIYTISPTISSIFDRCLQQ